MSIFGSLIIYKIMADIKGGKGKAKIGHSLEQLEDGIILTLQDQPVLQNGQINEEDDVLENFERRKDNEDAHNREIRQKLKTIANAATSHIEAKNEGRKSLLPHYDDYRYKSDYVDLEQGQTIKRNRPKLPKNFANDFEDPKIQNTNAEYYQRDKKKFKTRTAKEATDLLAFLDGTALDNNEESEEVQKDAADIIGESLKNLKEKKNASRESGSIEFHDEEEELLANAVKRSRNRASKQKSSVLEIIKEEGSPQDAQGQYTQIELKPITVGSKLVVDPQFSIRDAASGTTSCLFVNLPSEKLSKKENASEMPNSFEQISREELERMKEELKFMEDQSLGTGLADTLKYLRENNLLQQEGQFGRSNDQASEHNQPGDRVKIEYRNASGQLMKPKQAFRYMSAIFHGQGPGKNKIEKIKKKELLEMKIKEAANSQSKLLGILSKHQQKSGEAHMVVEFGKKGRKAE